MVVRVRLSNYRRLAVIKGEVIASASRFDKISHWEHYDPQASYAARVNGWLEEATSHMIQKRVVSTPHRLTNAEIFESAKIHLYKGDWHKHDSRAYQAAKLRGIFKDATSHMESRRGRETVVGQDIFVVCGVCGSGKSWVCNQLEGVTYVKYDKISGKNERISAVLRASLMDLPVVFDPVIHISSYLKRFPSKNTHLVCIIEDESTLRSRLEGRGSKKGLTFAGLQRMKRIQWYADHKAEFSGTSQQVLDWIRSQATP